MLNLLQAEEALKKAIDIKEIKECKDYGTDYLFVAFKTDNFIKQSREIDPFYLVDKNTGKVRPYTIANDINRFYSSKNIM